MDVRDLKVGDHVYGTWNDSVVIGEVSGDLGEGSPTVTGTVLWCPGAQAALDTRIFLHPGDRVTATRILPMPKDGRKVFVIANAGWLQVGGPDTVIEYHVPGTYAMAFHSMLDVGFGTNNSPNDPIAVFTRRRAARAALAALRAAEPQSYRIVEVGPKARDVRPVSHWVVNVTEESSGKTWRLHGVAEDTRESVRTLIQDLRAAEQRKRDTEPNCNQLTYREQPVYQEERT